MTPTFRIGTFNNTFKNQHSIFKERNSSGFTLFELIIVIFIISLTTALIMPSFWDTGDRALKREAKQIAGTLRYIYDEAAGKKKPFVLTFNIDKGLYTFKSDNETRSYILKGNVMFKSISVPSLGNIPKGELIMEVGPLGPAEPLTVHLLNDEREYTVIFNHINGRARIYEGHMVLK